MSKHIRIIAVSAVLAVAAVGIAVAGEQGKVKSKGNPTKSVPFTVSGVFSGSISDEIVVDGQSVIITNKTSVHRVDKGPVEVGESVSSSAIMVSGVMKGKKAIATMVLIGDRTSTEDFSLTTIAGAERDPKSSKGR
jgi:hypothetical protein